MLRRSISASLGGLAILLIAARDGAATPVNVPLNIPSGVGSFQTQCAPVIRSLGGKVVAVWYDTRTPSSNSEPRIHYGVSVDSGATFLDFGTPPAPFTTVAWRWRGDAQIAIDAGTSAVFVAGYVMTTASPFLTGLAVVKGTFSGSSLIWGTPVLLRTGLLFRIGTLAFESGTGGGSLHLLVANYGAGGLIEYQRSTDANGAVWSAPVTLSSLVDNGTVMFPRLAAGPGSVLHAAWAGAHGLASEPIRYRSSNDLGLTWAAEQTPATMRANPMMPAQILASTLDGKYRNAFSMAANRISGSTTVGSVAFAWAETWDFSDEAFPPLATTLQRNEAEPNDSAALAQSFTPGDALVGSLSPVSDVDFWRVTMAAGDPILIWSDSASTAAIVKITIFSADGVTAYANGYGGPAAAAFSFRAPTSGDYYLQVAAGIGPSYDYYRVRTRTGSPTAGEARDLRDLAAIYSTATGWSGIVRPAFGPPGYDDYLPTIGFGSDGLDYITWYEMSAVPTLASGSQLVVARNLAGPDPVLSPPAIVTDAATDWNAMMYIIPPATGSSNNVSADSRRLFLGWTDGRDTNPDAYAASLTTTAVITSYPNDTSATAGTTATLRLGVNNQNPMFDEKVLVTVSGARSWPAFVARDSVPPGSQGFVHVPIAVPDSAAPGTYLISMVARRQSGIVLGSFNASLSIQAVNAVGDGSASAFSLDPITPNPARSSARVAFAVPIAGPVRIAIYGITGNLVRTLVNSEHAAGPHAVSWDGLDNAGHRVPIGMYLVRLEGAGKSASRRVVMVR